MEQKPTGEIAVIKDAADSAFNAITEYVEHKSLTLPPNYSAANAIRTAQLLMQDNADIMNCTKASIYKSLLEMSIAGLSPSADKAQCYFIAYGKKCTMQPSYYGYEAIAMRIDPTIKEIIAHPVKEGEDFDFEIQPDGYYKILKHKPTLATMAKRECIGAYATINYNDGKPPRSMVVSWEEIEQAWRQSKMQPFDESGKLKKTATHYKFFNDMVKKTIAAKITKPIIRTADDSNLFGQTIKAIELESETAKADADQDAAVASEPNGEIIDAEYEIAEE